MVILTYYLFSIRVNTTTNLSKMFHFIQHYLLHLPIDGSTMDPDAKKLADRFNM